MNEGIELNREVSSLNRAQNAGINPMKFRDRKALALKVLTSTYHNLITSGVDVYHIQRLGLSAKA